MLQVLRSPGAWLPFAMAGLAVVMVVAAVVVLGTVAQPSGDEGAPARLFQLLMLADAAVIATFAARWLPRAPREALVVLGLQILAAAVPIVLITLLEAAA